MGKPARTPPIPLDRLIALWKISLPVSIERELLSEISRLHGVLVEMRALTDTVEKAWAEECRSKLVAIHRMRLLLDEEPAIVGGKFSNSKNNLQT
ncbi:hypothetical protein ACOTEE_27555 [Achromobacter xylosoxidans]